ncbi:phage tail protein [Acinetobacter schindleri]|uniref:Phage tail fibre protein N-terminal domain-containing protein n=1 Tax=Acinetobacter schindleri NIPH 900 TaxID=1217675 RepID=N8Y544_9GAMM|nr:phage tail protein [Acinetobacter schindleri]ENV14738.1 hypothetical protein F965_00084 [Acinetobacter schindleri NIPH 900]
MSDPIKLYITKAGLYAFFDAKANGITLKLDKMKYSSSNFVSVHNDPRTELPNVVSESQIVASGTTVSTNTIRFVTVVNSTEELHVGAVGVYTTTGVLFAVASVPQGSMFKVYNGISFVATFGISLSAQLLESINVVLDPEAPLATSLVMNHEKHGNPHPQYAFQQDVNNSLVQLQSQINTLINGQGNLGSQFLGVGQTYRDVRGSRVNNGTTYVNPTNKPILVILQLFLSDKIASGTVRVEGLVIADMYAHMSNGSVKINAPFTFIVQPGKGYSLTNGSVQYWTEMAT